MFLLDPPLKIGRSTSRTTSADEAAVKLGRDAE